METIFNWMANAFYSNYVFGFGSVGITLSCIALVCYILYWAGLSVWAFIEDEKIKSLIPQCFKVPDWEASDKRSFLRNEDIADDFIKHRSCSYSSYYYYKKDTLAYKVDECRLVAASIFGAIGIIMVSGLLGIIVEAFIWAPVFFSVLFSSIGLVFLARGIRRLQKKLTKHINDIDAHKREETKDGDKT